jgi:hypothetical protein
VREFLDEIDELVNGDGLEKMVVEDPEGGQAETIVTDRELWRLGGFN